MYEVELKARLKAGQIEEIKNLIENTYRCNSEICVYHDTYFDNRGQDLMKSERELRLRRITRMMDESIFLTYKEKPFDQLSKSKLEHEVIVSNYDESAAILKLLGYSEDIRLLKHCINYSLEYRSWPILITLVRINELNQDFIEVEVQTEQAELINSIFNVMHEFMLNLNIMPDQLTNEYYTDLFRKASNNF